MSNFFRLKYHSNTYLQHTNKTYNKLISKSIFASLYLHLLNEAKFLIDT